MNKLKLVIVGHVDHGKSTLVGRLLHETGALPDGKVQAVKAMSEKRGMPFEWAFVIDAMQAERDQGITIDTTQIRFKTAARDYLLIDAPGHKQFLKNMVSGAAGADAVVLVVDAHEGVQDQTRRHAYLLRLLGIRRIIVAVNKMDLVGYAEERYQEVRRDVAAYLRSIGVDALDITFVPLAARDGENLRSRSAMPWYEGPTLLEALDAVPQPVAATDLPLRLTVQDVYKFDQRRIIAGRIESGSLHVGDTLLFSPINASARVSSIESWNAPAADERGGRPVGRHHAGRGHLHRARPRREPRPQRAGGHQRVPRQPVLARARGAGAGRAVSPAPRRRRDARHDRAHRPRGRHQHARLRAGGQGGVERHRRSHHPHARAARARPPCR